MKVGVKIPQQGLTVETVSIVEIYCEKGDIVAEGQPVVAIESNKAILDIEAPVSGTISEIIGKVGDECNIGQIVMYIEK